MLAYAHGGHLQFRNVHLPRRAHLPARSMPHTSAALRGLRNGTVKMSSKGSQIYKIPSHLPSQDVDCAFGFDRESVICKENKCQCANGFYQRSENICRRILHSKEKNKSSSNKLL